MARILIVDDEEDICNLLKEVLSDWGHVVLTANNGDDALRCLNEEQLDVVFLDRRMPGMGGQEVLKSMSDDGMLSHVIIMTADVDEATYEEMKMLGAVEVISKPFDMLNIRDELARILPSVFT